MARTPTSAFIGAGAVATVLARRMVAHGYAIEGVISRTKASAAVLAERVGAPVASSSVEDLPENPTWIFICVPDDEISGVCEQLCTVDHRWEQRIVVHTAGALSSETLRPLARKGAAVGSMHPVQTFTRASDPELLEGSIITIEGDERTETEMRMLASNLGARPILIALAARSRIHLAASIASNYFVTLVGMAETILQRTELPEEEARALLRPLVERTLQNIFATSPQEALTGPVQRGDVDTLRRHRHLLEREASHLVPLFEELVKETARLAGKNSRFPLQAARDLAELLGEE